jgi:hypothetical protein
MSAVTYSVLSHQDRIGLVVRLLAVTFQSTSNSFEGGRHYWDNFYVRCRLLHVLYRGNVLYCNYDTYAPTKITAPRLDEE